jgi:demethylmenaquinone methyltransferase/2-methoxy-6-polyprenyl-1,4-benzoquinol methylase
MTENIYKPEYVKELFNKMSSSYERMNFITSFGFSIRWRRQFLNVFESTKEKIEIIDLLTGMGETWNSVKQKFPNSALSSLDFSQEMLKRAKLKSEKHYNNKIELIENDVLQNNLSTDKYDIVICAFGLKTFDIEQLETLAKQTKRILKPGGKFSFIEVSKPNNRILKFLYKLYIGKIIPIIGKLLLGNPREYKMLWKYTEKFENAKRASEIFNKNGLKSKFNSYFYGCATGFSGIKEK